MRSGMKTGVRTNNRGSSLTWGGVGIRGGGLENPGLLTFLRVKWLTSWVRYGIKKEKTFYRVTTEV